jgi:2-keto-3-deoxy-L-rhamnonate aldolase RhmA
MTPSTLPIQSGAWLSIGSPVIAELAAGCGFDWLLFDLEHGCESEAAVPAQLRAVSGYESRAIVRVGAPYPDLIGRVLDWGAHGVMVPHINNAAEAAACVEAMRYSPVGKRGFSRSVRAYGYGLKPAPSPDEMVQPLFMAQIETIAAVKQIDEIVAVDGVDVLFVGPADLQFDLQARPGECPWDYYGCLQRVAEASALAGKECGILVRNPADINALIRSGFTYLALDSDLAVLRQGFQKSLNLGQGPR